MRRWFRVGLSLLLVAAAILAGESAAHAQTAAIAGRVTDASTGAPLEAVTVQIEGTELGALTTAEGTYRVAGIPPGSVTVVVTVIGYQGAESVFALAAGDVEEVNFLLEPRAIVLEGVVGSVEAAAVRRKELGTDITRIAVPEALETAAINSFTDLLNARAENVQISPGSGQVGTGARITVRGASSLTQENVPLIVVDGIRYSNQTQLDPTDRAADSGGPIDTGGQTTSRFEDLRPHDIQTIEVIKGPTAATLYGSEAASGVLVITTNKGATNQEPRIALRTRQGFQVDVSDYPANYSDVTGGFGVTDPTDPRLAGFRTAQNPVTRTVYVIDHPLEDEDTSPFRMGWNSTIAGNVSGGGDNSRYYGSLEHEHLEGTVQANVLDRFRGRANFAVQVSDVADVSISTSYVRHNLDFVDTSTQFGWVAASLLGSPTNSFGDSPAPSQGLCLSDALSDGEPTGVCDGRNGLFLTTFDNLARIDQGEELRRFTGSVAVNLTPTPWLTVNATGGIDDFDRTLGQLIPFDPQGVFGGDSRGQFVNFLQRTQSITGDFGATARLPISSGLATTTSVGVQTFLHETEQTGCSGDTFSSTEITSCDGALITRGTYDKLENVEIGAFAQERVGWNDWIFATAGVRVDDHSALGENVGAILSPSANASIVLHEAPFWNVEFVDQLRLRVAWGKASQAPDQFAAVRTFVNAPVTVDGQPLQGLTAQNPGNPELGAERSEEFEAGFDTEFLSGRAGLSFTYFNSETTDAIVPVPVPPSSGFPGVRFVNLGGIANQGIEAKLDARVTDTEAVQWDVRLVLSTQDPVVTSLGLDEPIFFPSGDVGTTSAGFSQVFAPGLTPGAYVSSVVESATRDENGNITDFTLAPGDPGLGGKKVVGSPVVRNEQSLSSRMTLFGNLQIFTLFDRDGANDLLNTSEAFQSPFILPSSSSPTSTFSERWAFRHLESPETQAEIEQRFVNPYIYDGSFIRWRELTVSYRVPQDFAGRFGLEEATLSIGGRNLATWTDFPGIDVEGNIQGAQDNFVRGVAFEFGAPRTFFTELTVTF